MASNSSKALPYLAMLIVVLSLFAEAYFEWQIDLNAAMPFLMAVGLGGAGLSAVKAAADARAKLPKNIEELIKSEIQKLKH